MTFREPSLRPLSEIEVLPEVEAAAASVEAEEGEEDHYRTVLRVVEAKPRRTLPSMWAIARAKLLCGAHDSPV
jgi:hypothetical protein